MEFDPKKSIKEIASYRRPVTFSHCLCLMQAWSFAHRRTPAILVFAAQGKSVTSGQPLPPSSWVGGLMEVLPCISLVWLMLMDKFSLVNIVNNHPLI